MAAEGEAVVVAAQLTRPLGAPPRLAKALTRYLHAR